MKSKRRSIDEYAYSSRLKKWNASYKVVFTMTALITTVTLNSIPISVMTMIFMGGLSCILGKIKISDYFRLLLIPVGFILLSGAAILVQFGSGTGSFVSIPIFSTHLYITKDSIETSLLLGIKALGAVSCLYMLVLSTPMGEILNVLRKIRVPNIVLELMHFIYRYIFILYEINHAQKDAVKARLGYCDRKTAISTFGKEMPNLLLLSMRRADLYYDALESRGYEGNCLFFEEKRKLTSFQLMWGVIYVVLLLLFS